MKAFNLAGLTLAIVLVVSLLSIVLYPSAQDFMRANPFWNGLRDFGNRFGAEFVTDLNQVKLGPEGSVLIAIPYIPYEDEELRQIEDFVRSGGTLLLMDDYGYGNQVLHALQLDMEFAGAPLLDPYLNYRNEWLPLVVDLAIEFKEVGIEHLILNHATALFVSGPYEVLARSSDTSYIRSGGTVSREERTVKGPLVVAARAPLGRGTVIAVSDPSILINSMVDRGDNGTFLKTIISGAGESPSVAVDTSHLTRVPLDRSKDAWEMARERISLPYSQALLVAAILVLTFMPVWRKGDRLDTKQ